MNIMVLGCSGGGKSITAFKLAEMFDLRVIHFDLLLWKPGWVRRDDEEINQMAEVAFRADGWVSDGNHSKAQFDERVKRADMLVWVDMPRWRCIMNISTRVWKYRGKSRPSMTEGCPERLNLEFFLWVWNFNKNRGQKIEKLFEKMQSEKRLYRLKNYTELNEFLNNMQKEAGFQGAKN